MSEKGGLSGVLALFRVGLSNPPVRLLLKAMFREVDVDGHRRPLIDVALAYFAGVVNSAMLSPTARFFSSLFSLYMKLALALLNTDDKFAKQLLADPAVRRGVLLVFKSIAEHGLTLPPKLEAPFFIVWNFTNLCNLRCMHCYQRSTGETLLNELTYAEKIKVVAELDRMFVCGVALSGGEPTIHPHFIDVLTEISRRGMYPAIATNGIALSDPHFVRKLKKIGLRYAEISIDHSKPQVHDKFRGVPGAWEKAVRGVQNCAREGIFTAIATTVTKMNIDDIENMIQLAEDLGARRIVFFNFIPVGRGYDNYKLDLTPEEREEVLRTLARESKRRSIEIVTTAPQYGRVVLQVTSGELVSPTHFTPALRLGIYRAAAEFIGGCGAGRVYFAIEPEGTVTPCVFMPIAVGNVRKDSLHELWLNDPLFNKLRDRSNLKGMCRVCKYRNICGGCRARALAYYGDPLMPDPGCIYCRNEYYKLINQGPRLRQAEFKLVSWKS